MPPRPATPELLLTLWDLHPELGKAQALYLDGYLADAVRTAADGFIERLRAVVAEQASEIRTDVGLAQLLETAFGARRGEQPALSWNDYSSTSEEREHWGLTQLTRGLASALRNPYSHGYERPMPARKALLWLGFISVMHEELDGAGPVAAGGG